MVNKIIKYIKKAQKLTDFYAHWIHHQTHLIDSCKRKICGLGENNSKNMDQRKNYRNDWNLSVAGKNAHNLFLIVNSWAMVQQGLICLKPVLQCFHQKLSYAKTDIYTNFKSYGNFLRENMIAAEDAHLLCPSDSSSDFTGRYL